MAGRNSYWSNDDGLVVGFGTRDTERNIAAQTSSDGATEELVMVIHGTELTDADEPTNFITGAPIPANSLIVSGQLIVDTAFTSGGAAVLDIGTYTSAGAAIDDDGIDAAIAVGALTADTLIASDGAQIGTVVTQDAYIAATYDTAAFTAGTAKLVVKYIKQ